MGSPTHSRSRPLLHPCGAEACFMSPEMIHPSLRILLVSGNKSNKNEIKNSNLLIETPERMHCRYSLCELGIIRICKTSSLQPAGQLFRSSRKSIPGLKKYIYR